MITQTSRPIHRRDNRLACSGRALVSGAGSVSVRPSPTGWGAQVRKIRSREAGGRPSSAAAAASGGSKAEIAALPEGDLVFGEPEPSDLDAVIPCCPRRFLTVLASAHLT